MTCSAKPCAAGRLDVLVFSASSQRRFGLPCSRLERRENTVKTSSLRRIMLREALVFVTTGTDSSLYPALKFADEGTTCSAKQDGSRWLLDNDGNPVGHARYKGPHTQPVHKSSRIYSHAQHEKTEKYTAVREIRELTARERRRGRFTSKIQQSSRVTHYVASAREVLQVIDLFVPFLGRKLGLHLAPRFSSLSNKLKLGGGKTPRWSAKRLHASQSM